ncbi:MAG: tRNA preQ1(34) S-adenosylmethionine ribosyltransferase-isomerase QueA [Syntrophales bacterium]|jgi:S-adenosylmethionine:tRNA ribosyltransferase-isomerase
MNLSDFNYHLPLELIAQEPSEKRDRSRMMILDRNIGRITEDVFFNLPEYFEPGDVVVLNDSKVIPARLIGKKETGGSVEILLLFDKSGGEKPLWESLLKPGRLMHPGTRIRLDGGAIAKVITALSENKWLVEFDHADPFDEYIERYGHAPLPPYIKRPRNITPSLHDKERYQTIYARIPGSVAAPTAGLHFSKEVIHALQAKGVDIASVTLHVGYGTFKPMIASNIEDHRMEEEFYEITHESMEHINRARRVVAIGTTSTRVLESAADSAGRIQAASGWTKLFIYPGYRFKRVNILLTNFHLPKSTLLSLVCAFAGYHPAMEAYRHAVENRFRFYSYGDCMLIL